MMQRQCDGCGHTEPEDGVDANRWHTITVVYGPVRPLSMEKIDVCRDCDPVAVFVKVMAR